MKRSLPVLNKWLPWIIAGVFGVWILSTLRMPRDKEWALSDFGKLPLLSNGRFQPMDSLARNSLLQMLEKQSLRLQDEKRTMPATEWLMEVMMNQEKADTRKVFRIAPGNYELKSLLKLPSRNLPNVIAPIPWKAVAAWSCLIRRSSR